MQMQAASKRLSNATCSSSRHIKPRLSRPGLRLDFTTPRCVLALLTPQKTLLKIPHLCLCWVVQSGPVLACVTCLPLFASPCPNAVTSALHSLVLMKPALHLHDFTTAHLAALLCTVLHCVALRLVALHAIALLHSLAMCCIAATTTQAFPVVTALS